MNGEAEEWRKLVDSKETHPDWEPDDGDYAAMDHEEEEQIWYVIKEHICSINITLMGTMQSTPNKLLSTEG
ncbi:hypothetical protein CHS0354_022275, partial [Potamilus streckersoni]